MATEQCKKLVESYHDATNRGDLNTLDAIAANDFINQAAGFDPVQGRDGMKTLIRELPEAFPDWHVTMEDMVAENNKVLCAGP
jgi:predicted ester cyclase